MTNNSIKLAQLWIDLRIMKDKLDNEILPVSSHLEVDDAELMTAMENLSEAISNHFERFKLVAETIKANQAPIA